MEHETVDNTASFFLPATLLAAAGIHERYFEVLDAVRAETRSARSTHRSRTPPFAR